MHGADKVPVHETLSSVNYFSSQTSVHNTFYLSKLQACFFHNYVREGSRQWLFCQKTYRHIVLSQFENILRANSVDDGLDMDLILCDLLEVQA